MVSAGIEHKLRVFVSSKCGDKYTVARKALKILLESTGLIEAYVFETEPSSSEDTRSAYLEYVDGSNLCVFIVDNQDGVPPAVISEEKRAKELDLRLLYVFCDENKREPTPMQCEIKDSMSQKYSVVHEFSDVVPKAFDSVMQDVIAVYKKKPIILKDEHCDESITEEFPTIETGSITDTCSTEFPSVVQVLNVWESAESDSAQSTDKEVVLEQLLYYQLQSLLFLKPFKSSVISDICGEMMKKHTGDYSEIIPLRFKALKQFYQAEYEQCLDTLKELESLASEKAKTLPWLASDISSDIEYVQHRIKTHKYYTFVPCLYRSELPNTYHSYFQNLDSEIVNLFQDKEFLSIFHDYAKSGILKRLRPFSNAYCSAVQTGAIYQTEYAVIKLFSYYSVINSYFHDHFLFKEYIRQLIINLDAKSLDNVLKEHEQYIQMLNGSDMAVILNSIDCMSDQYYKMQAKYLLASRLGYYLDDSEYSELYTSLAEYSINWVKTKQTSSPMLRMMYDFFSHNTLRNKPQDLIDFIIPLAQNSDNVRIDQAVLNLIRTINYESLDDNYQTKCIKLFIDITRKNRYANTSISLQKSIIRFCKTATVSINDLKSILQAELPELFVDLNKYLNTGFNELDLRQSINSHSSIAKGGSAAEIEDLSLNTDYYSNILRIINRKEVVLSLDFIKEIVEISFSILSKNDISAYTKMYAIMLLQAVYSKDNSSNEIWDSVFERLTDNIDSYIITSGKRTSRHYNNSVFLLQYSLFICQHDNVIRENIINKLYTFRFSNYCLSWILYEIAVFLNYSKANEVDEKLLSSILFFSLHFSHSNDSAIRLRAIRCLAKLAKHPSTMQLSLLQMSLSMDNGNVHEKEFIVSQAIKLNDSNEYVKQIIDKGKSDNNYLVRYQLSIKHADDDIQLQD